MDDDVRLSRRQLLAGVAGAGGIGTLAGGLTGAALGDIEPFRNNRFVAGSLELDVGWTGPGAGPTDGSLLLLDIGPLDAGESGYSYLSVSLPSGDGQRNNPATVWLQTHCPTPTTLLDDFLRVQLSYVDCETGDPIQTVFDWGSLRDFANALRNGIQLVPQSGGTGDDGDCLPVDDPLCLRLDYTLDEGYVGTESTRMYMDLVGMQCRHDAGELNPFTAQEECPEPECLCCERVGKLEIADNYIEPGIYDFTENCNGYTGYQLQVLDTETKDGGTETVAAAVRVLDPSGSPVQLCEAEYKGGADSTTVAYDDPVYETDLIFAPERDDSYYGISHITMSICSLKPPLYCDDGGCE